MGSTRELNFCRVDRRDVDAAGVHETRALILRCPRKSVFRAGQCRPQWVLTRAIRGAACRDIFARCPMMIRPNCIKFWRNRVSVRVETWRS